MKYSGAKVEKAIDEEASLQRAIADYRSSNARIDASEFVTNSVVGEIPIVGSFATNSVSASANYSRGLNQNKLGKHVDNHREQLENLFPVDLNTGRLPKVYSTSIMQKLDDDRIPADLKLKYVKSFVGQTTDSIESTVLAFGLLKQDLSGLKAEQASLLTNVEGNFKYLREQSVSLEGKLDSLNSNQDDFIGKLKQHISDFDQVTQETQKSLGTLLSDVGSLDLKQDKLTAINKAIVNEVTAISQVSQSALANWQAQAANNKGFENNHKIQALQVELSHLSHSDQANTGKRLALIAAIRDEKAIVVHDRKVLSEKIDRAGQVLAGAGHVVAMFNPQLGQKIQQLSEPLVNIGQNIAGMLGVGALALVNPVTACFSIVQGISAIMSVFAKKGPSDLDIILKTLEKVVKQLSAQIHELKDEMRQSFDEVFQHLTFIEREMFNHFIALSYGQKTLQQTLVLLQQTLASQMSSQNTIANTLVHHNNVIFRQLYQLQAGQPWQDLERFLPDYLNASSTKTLRHIDKTRDIIINAYKSQAPADKEIVSILTGSTEVDALAMTKFVAEQLRSKSSVPKIKHPMLYSASMLTWLLNTSKYYQQSAEITGDQLHYLETVFPGYEQAIKKFFVDCRAPALIDAQIKKLAGISHVLAENVKVFIQQHELRYNLELLVHRDNATSAHRQHSQHLLRNEVKIDLPDAWFRYQSTERAAYRERRGGIAGMFGEIRTKFCTRTNDGVHEAQKQSYIIGVKQKLHAQNAAVLADITKPLENHVSLVDLCQIDRAVTNACLLPLAMRKRHLTHTTYEQLKQYGPALRNVPAFSKLIPEIFFHARAWGVGDIAFYYDLLTVNDKPMITFQAEFHFYPSQVKNKSSADIEIFSLRKEMAKSVMSANGQDNTVDEQLMIESWCGLTSVSKAASTSQSSKSGAVVTKSTLPPQPEIGDALNCDIHQAIMQNDLSGVVMHEFSQVEQKCVVAAIQQQRHQLKQTITESLKSKLGVDRSSAVGANLQHLNEGYYELRTLLSLGMHDITYDREGFVAKWFDETLCHSHKILNRMESDCSLQQLVAELTQLSQNVSGLNNVIHVYRRYLGPGDTNMVVFNMVVAQREKLLTLSKDDKPNKDALAELQRDCLAVAFQLIKTDPSIVKSSLRNVDEILIDYKDSINQPKIQIGDKTMKNPGKDTTKDTPLVEEPGNKSDTGPIITDADDQEIKASNGNDKALALLNDNHSDVVVPKVHAYQRSSGEDLNREVINASGQVITVIADATASIIVAKEATKRTEITALAAVNLGESQVEVSKNELKISENKLKEKELEVAVRRDEESGRNTRHTADLTENARQHDESMEQNRHALAEKTKHNEETRKRETAKTKVDMTASLNDTVAKHGAHLTKQSMSIVNALMEDDFDADNIVLSASSASSVNTNAKEKPAASVTKESSSKGSPEKSSKVNDMKQFKLAKKEYGMTPTTWKAFKVDKALFAKHQHETDIPEWLQFNDAKGNYGMTLEMWVNYKNDNDEASDSEDLEPQEWMELNHFSITPNNNTKAPTLSNATIVAHHHGTFATTPPVNDSNSVNNNSQDAYQSLPINSEGMSSAQSIGANQPS